MRKAHKEPSRGARESGWPDIEILLNDLAAEQAAMRIVLQSFLLRLFATRPDTAPMALQQLRAHVVASVRAIPVTTEDAVGGTRWKEMVENRAEQLFAEIHDTMGMPNENIRPPN